MYPPASGAVCAPARRQPLAIVLSVLLLLPGFIFKSPFVPSVYADTGTSSVSLTTLGVAVTENFNTLSNTAASTTNTALPTGWYLTETGGGARDNEQYGVDTGGSNTGDTYSYGAAASTDRALGGLRSGTLISVFGAKFTNNTGSTITSLDIAYTGEEWRLGTAARTDQINFEISTNATDLSTGTYNGVAALNFVTPVTATVGAKDGNAAANRAALSTTISGLSIPSGASFFIRWTDTDATSADDGLAVDDFSVVANGNGTPTPTATPTPTPEPTPTPTPVPTPTPTPTPATPGSVVISQIYGGGGNTGAPLNADFVELFNRSSQTVSLDGWSVQYSSSAGSSWGGRTNLSGTLAPGQYYLVAGASGGANGVALPAADVTGTTNMSGTNGKVALVSSTAALTGTCPVGGTTVVDFVGYGGDANCWEGPASPESQAPTLSNATAALRTRNGCKDTDINSLNFTEVAPAPRNSLTPANVCPAGDFAPEVFSTDPANGGVNYPLATNITVNFDAAVNVMPGGFTLSCTTSGAHTLAVTGGPTTFALNPDTDFAPGETCTAAVLASHVTSQTTPPVAMAADYVWSFGTLIVRDAAEHMVMGNPSGAVADEAAPLNYLMLKPQFALSYNNEKGTPNWTSWHLDSSWTTSVADRQNDFRFDPALPAGFKRVQSGYNFATYGFDRGHMTPSADRTSSEEDNSATFLMTNMVPQASGNNQGPWNDLEGHIRTLLGGSANEIYIVSGGHGVGGQSTTGNWDTITDTGGNTVTVPDLTWKVIMVMPRANGDDVARVSAATRTFAVIMPNDDNIREHDWKKYLATVDQVEALTGYNFFSNVPEAIQNVIEAQLDAEYDTAPVASGQTVATAEDTAKAITLAASDFNVNNVLTYTVVGQPAHGQLSGTGGVLTYTPFADYSGPDSFTFRVNDGGKDSNTATVNINVTPVNDAPAATDDAFSINEDAAAADVNVLGNDTDVENDALTVTAVGAASHGTATLVGGVVKYAPAANYSGADSFTYTVSDGDKTATATVNVTVEPVNDGPVATADSATTDEDTPVSVDVVFNDTDAEGDTLALESVSDATHGSVAVAGGKAVFTPEADYNGPASFNYVVTDGNGGTATGTVSVTVRSVNDAPTLSGVPASANVAELSAYTFTATAGDVDNGQTLTFSLLGAPEGATISAAGVFTWTPSEAQGGTGSPFVFTVRVSDGTANTDSPVSITVGEVNQAPTLAPIGPKVVAYGGTLAFTADGSDADLPAQGLAYSLTGSVPAGASINPSTGAFAWTPTAAQAGHVYTFGVRVTDAFGLFAEEVINVGVGHTWSGYLQPINAGGGSVFKAGQTVPVKFQLTGASAGVTNAVARLYVAKLTNSVVGTEEEADSTSNATEGNLFRYTDGQYIFNFSTKGLTAGTYQLRVDLGDGVLRAVNISLR